MAAYDDALDDARHAVIAELSKYYVRDCKCDSCVKWCRAARRIVRALAKLRNESPYPRERSVTR